MGQSVICRHYESVECSVAMPMITPVKPNDTCLGLNTISYSNKTFMYTRFFHMQSASLWWLGKFHCCCLSSFKYKCPYCEESDSSYSTSCHSTSRPHRDHCHPGQPYHALNTWLVYRSVWGWDSYLL